MRKFRILIADDESPARDELKHILSKIDYVKVAGEAVNGVEVLKKIDNLNPDMVLLDIEMPGLNGIDVAKRMMKKKKPPRIIFATAYDTYAVSAFEVNAIDYILKPFDASRIKKAIERAKDLLEANDSQMGRLEELLKSMSKEDSRYLTKIPVKLKGKITFIEIADVVYARAEGGLIFISENGKEHLSDFPSLDRLEKDLNPDIFLRAHRSYLVNLENMKEIAPLGSGHYTIKCKTKTGHYIDIPLSRRQAKTLKDKFKF